MFVPLVVETLGGWDSDAVTHLRAIAKQASAVVFIVALIFVRVLRFSRVHIQRPTLLALSFIAHIAPLPRRQSF